MVQNKALNLTWLRGGLLGKHSWLVAQSIPLQRAKALQDGQFFIEQV
jgi:hypothetical protein